MRFGFVTCVQLGLSCLETIRDLGSEPELLITLHDDRAQAKSGRIWLDDFAEAGANHLVKVANINGSHSRSAIAAAQLDWLFVVGWSQIVEDKILEIPRLGCVGMHPTLLPQGRGRAPIPWAIIKDLSQTGVSMFALDSGMDTGPIIAQQEVAIEQDENASTLYHKVDRAHETLIRKTWESFESGTVAPTPQDNSKATIWPGRKPEDGQLAASMTVKEMDRHVRALTPPYPGAWWRDSSGRTWLVEAGATSNVVESVLEIPAVNGTYFATAARLLEDLS